MIPFKDNIPRERFALVTVALIAIVIVAYALSPPHAGLLALVLDVIFIWLLGPSVENTLGRARFLALCLLGALVGLALRISTGISSPSLVVFGASGLTAGVLVCYLLRHPQARVLTLVPVPLYTTLVEVPAAILIGLWLLLQVCFAVVGLG